MGFIQRALGALGAWVIRLWIRVFGRTCDKSDVAWLIGPAGPAEGTIGEKPYDMVAEREGLTIDKEGDAGLVPDWDVLSGPSFDTNKTDPEVRRFYEETSRYRLDVWSETRFPGRLFLWLIVYTVSRYMNQLNFPVFGLEMSRGMTSEVWALRNDAGEAVYTGWFRKLLGSGRVIYTGFYTNVHPPGHDARCIKVTFPLPNGFAAVILRPGHDEAGRFRLLSSGKRFGDPGFYRVLVLDDERVKVLHMNTLREFFEVYTDEEGTLRCDHRVEFLGIDMLKLHYRMHRTDV